MPKRRATSKDCLDVALSFLDSFCSDSVIIFRGNQVSQIHGKQRLCGPVSTETACQGIPPDTPNHMKGVKAIMEEKKSMA